MKFLHAADIHIDSPLLGLERYEGAPVEELRLATRRAFVRLIELALQEQVDFVLIAGDLYDRNWRDFNTGLFFTSQVNRLREAGISLFLIAGNHDAANRMTMSLRLPDNVTFFSSQKPETKVIDSLGLAVHGQSFPEQHTHRNLAANYPIAIPGLFNIGLLHTSYTGRDGHDPYAPCSSSDLLSKEYHYWALGHVHQREVLHPEPIIVFPGNIQGRHARECGAKGCLIVEVDSNRKAKFRFRELDVFRWSRIEVDLGEASNLDDAERQVYAALVAASEAEEGIPLAIRVELIGETPIFGTLMSQKHRFIQDIRNQSFSVRSRIWIEKVKFGVRAPERNELTVWLDGAIEGIQRLCIEHRDRSLDDENSLLDITDVVKKLPAEIRDQFENLDATTVKQLYDQAAATLMSRLLTERSPT